MCVLDQEDDLFAERPGLLLLADKGCISAEPDHFCEMWIFLRGVDRRSRRRADRSGGGP
jgi:hypothetical protein